MGLPALEADYLFLGPLLVQRLKDQVGDVPVEQIERPEQVLAADNRSRVLMVMWAGDVVPASEPGRAAGGASQKITQRWLVLLAVQNVGMTAAARQDGAGPWLSRIHKALAGWKPEGAVHPLTRASSSMAPDFTKTKGLFPMGFEIQLNL